MTRLLTLALATMSATAIVMAQAPAPRPGDQPSTQQPATPSPSPGRPTASPAEQTPSPSPSSSSSAASADKVTYTGCLKPGTTAGTWVLENAQVASAAGSAAASSDKAVGTAGASSSKESFNLTVKPSDNLTPHANHKIEITGTTSPAIATSMSAGASSTPSASAPKLNFSVDSFKMVSASCQ
jgi:hypothetical protein